MDDAQKGVTTPKLSKFDVPTPPAAIEQHIVTIIRDPWGWSPQPSGVAPVEEYQDPYYTLLCTCGQYYKMIPFAFINKTYEEHVAYTIHTKLGLFFNLRYDL